MTMMTTTATISRTPTTPPTAIPATAPVLNGAATGSDIGVPVATIVPKRLIACKTNIKITSLAQTGLATRKCT